MSLLSIYEKEKENSHIVICVINVYNNYKLLKYLNLNADIFFIDSIHYSLFKKPISFYKKLREYSTFFYKEVLNRYLFDKVYYFSSFDDFITSYLIIKFFNRTKIIFIDHYDYIEQYHRINENIFWKIKLYAYKHLFNLKFRHQITTRGNLEFFYQDYNIARKTIAGNVIETSLCLYKIDSKYNTVKPKCLFYVDSDMGIPIQQSIIKILQQKYYVVIKGHPRKGTPNELVQIADGIIDEFIIGELLNKSNFDIIIGFYTTAIAIDAKQHNRVYSLVYLIDKNDFIKENIFSLISYLDVLSDNKIKYIKNFQDIL